MTGPQPLSLRAPTMISIPGRAYSAPATCHREARRTASAAIRSRILDHADRTGALSSNNVQGVTAPTSDL